jgi:LysM repeat protein
MGFRLTRLDRTIVWHSFLAIFIWLVLASPSFADTIYTVQTGDSAWSIAIRFGVTLEALYEANGWASDEDPVLQIGQRIAIPSETDAAAEESPDNADSSQSDDTYAVQEGDCPSIIADKLGIGTLELLEYNNLTGEDSIQAGQVLRIPPEGYECQGAYDTDSGNDASQADSQPTAYVVQAGDCLWTIARNFQVGVQAICDANGISRETILSVGSEIVIPSPEVTPTESRITAASVYTVVAGDTLSGIASRFGISQVSIIEANGLTNANTIRAGIELVIPGFRGSPETQDVDETPPDPSPPRTLPASWSPCRGSTAERPTCSMSDHLFSTSPLSLRRSRPTRMPAIVPKAAGASTGRPRTGLRTTFTPSGAGTPSARSPWRSAFPRMTSSGGTAWTPAPP